ncbi:MAG TPA: DUF2071 domain-containing protein [Fimbriimonas sp.]|nr:DUF2071 domain-containing protein [Fimbriimonas sp.]
MLATIRGTIARRLLINYRCDPDLVQALLPGGYRPKLQKDFAVAGICLIRLEHMRPPGLPSVLGTASENAAHRFAVLDEAGNSSVFIPRRDTSSFANTLLAGLAFPIHQHKANFKVQDDGRSVTFEMDGPAGLNLTGSEALALPSDSVFSSIEDASEFFQEGSVGRSADGVAVQLVTKEWRVKPFEVSELHSRFFDGFPQGSVEFDHGLVMRNVPHEWRVVS